MLLRKIRREEQSITDETISIRAYELWQARGCPAGDGAEDWIAAQQQLASESNRFLRRRPLLRILKRLRRKAA